MRINFQQARESVKDFVENGVCEASNPKVGNYVNRACARLVDSGKWVGQIKRIAFCHRAGLLTMPPEVETVLQLSDCGVPVTVSNEWFSFLPGGPWQMSQCNPWIAMEDRGDNWPVAFDVMDGYKVRLFSDWTQDDGSAVLLQGYNSDGNWVQTESGGEIVDGEILIANNATPPTSVTTWGPGGIRVVQKQVTDGPLRLYQVNPDTDAVAGFLAQWGPNEENPAYRRYFYGAFCGRLCNPSDEEDNNRYHPLTFLCKMRFIPLVRDTDMVPITAPGALENMVQALWFEKINQLELAVGYQQRAEQCLQNELRQYQGAINHMGSRIAGFGNHAPVRNFR